MAKGGSCRWTKRTSRDCVSLIEQTSSSQGFNDIVISFRQVLEVIAAIKGEDAEKLSEIFYNNTMKVFFSD